MSVFDRKRTFMIKKFGPSKYKKNLKFAKSHIYRVLGASKVKSDFSTYFSIEKSYSKNVFCIINLVHRQVYQVEKHLPNELDYIHFMILEKNLSDTFY